MAGYAFKTKHGTVHVGAALAESLRNIYPDRVIKGKEYASTCPCCGSEAYYVDEEYVVVWDVKVQRLINRRAKRAFAKIKAIADAKGFDGPLIWQIDDAKDIGL